MTIRPARPDDAVAIAAIANEIIRDTLVTFTTMQRTPAQITSEINSRAGHYLVGVSDGQVAGFATYAPFRAGPGYAHTREHSIQLAPWAQGRGLGRALMVELEQVARAEGVHALIAGISSANPQAVAFHAALGFAEVGRMPEVGRKWGRWLDLILMQKIIVSE